MKDACGGRIHYAVFLLALPGISLHIQIFNAVSCGFPDVCHKLSNKPIRAMRKGRQMIVERELRQKRKLRGKKRKMKLKEIHFEHVILLDRKTIYLKLQKHLPSDLIFSAFLQR